MTIKESKQYIKHLKEWRMIFKDRIKDIDKQLKQIEKMARVKK